MWNGEIRAQLSLGNGGRSEYSKELEMYLEGWIENFQAQKGRENQTPV